MLKKFLIGLVVLFVLISLVGVFLPSAWELRRSTTVDAGIEHVYPDLAELKTWLVWSAWNKERDPDCVHEFKGPASGKGATWKWKGGEPPEGLGEGSLTITEASPKTGIEYTIDFAGFGEIQGAVELEGRGDRTDVEWITQGDLGGNPYWKLMFHGMMLVTDDAAKEFDASLERLKVRCEARARSATQKPGK